ncbi:MAG: hypothetical protein GX488_08290 [Clostridiales bacterium]|nr:hypothetical protein [Clostridiales bacterium]
MLDMVLETIVDFLKRENISAFREFPERKSNIKSGVSVSVGIESCRYLSSGMGEYLGVRTPSGGKDEKELFGRRMEIELGLEIFSPFGGEFGASGCVRCADSLRECFGRLPPSIRALEMECGEIRADEKMSAFRCKCKLRCMAFLIAERSGDDTEFLDFVLKGTVDSGN